jgi:hypothetical protein
VRERLLSKGVWCGAKAGHHEHDVECPIFLRRAWYDLFDRYVRYSDGNTRSLCLRDDGRLTAFVPLYQDTSSRWRRLHSLTNFYSPIFRLQGDSPVAATDFDRLVGEHRRYLGRFSRIDLLPLSMADAICWRDAFAGIGFRGFIYEQSKNWFHDDIHDLDSFWAERPSRLKNTIRRKTHKLVATGEYEVGVVQPHSKKELDRYLAHYHRVYFSSWKRAEPHPAFIDAVARYAWGRGELRIGMGYHQEEPVAGQLWFTCGKTAYIFKLAHRPEYSKLSIGTILSKRMFDHVIGEDGVSCIDFLTGDDHYKADWMSKQRTLYGIQLCNPKTLDGMVGTLRNSFSRVYRRTVGTPAG